MSYLKAGATFLVAFLMQGSLLNLFSIGGYTPNLLLGLVVILSFLYEKELYGILYGALFGLLCDICYCDVIGPTPISFVLTAVVVIMMRYYANVENSISMSVVAVISFLMYYVINWGLCSIAGTPIGIGYVIANAIIPIIYTLAFVFVVYKVLIKDVVKHHKDRYFI